MVSARFPRPDWYTEQNDRAWGKIKEAFRREWRQTGEDFGGEVVSEANQNSGDNVTEVPESQAIPPRNASAPLPQPDTSYRDEEEPAYRYGYAAYCHYMETAQQEPATWEEARSLLEREWPDKIEWERHQDAIRRGWNYARLERYRGLPR